MVPLVHLQGNVRKDAEAMETFVQISLPKAPQRTAKQHFSTAMAETDQTLRTVGVVRLNLLSTPYTCAFVAELAYTRDQCLAEHRNTITNQDGTFVPYNGLHDDVCVALLSRLPRCHYQGCVQLSRAPMMVPVICTANVTCIGVSVAFSLRPLYGKH